MPYVPDAASAANAALGGRYVLGELVGRGGMAEVYRGHDRLLERPVAVKVFREHSNLLARRRFDEEAYVLARLSHPGLALIFDVGMLADRPFLVMEFIDGDNLQARLLNGALPPGEVMRIGGVLADALAHAHDRGVVHRDVKPSNIMLDRDGLPHLTDFGIALLSGAPRLTSADAIVGTPAYVAPEQLRGEEAGPPADIYALALALLECLTGEVEYPGGSSLAAALARLSRPPRIPAGLPVVLADLLATMTSTDPLDRPSARQCAERLIIAVAAPAAPVEPRAWWAEEDRTVVAPVTATVKPSRAPVRPGRRWLTAAGAGVVAVVAAVVFLMNGSTSLPGPVLSGSSAGHATSRPAISSGTGPGGGAGGDSSSSGPPAGRLVANERPALTVVSTSTPSTTPPTSQTGPFSISATPAPSTTTAPPTTTPPTSSADPPTTTSEAPTP